MEKPCGKTSYVFDFIAKNLRLLSGDNGPSKDYNVAVDSLAHLAAISLAAPLHTSSALPTQKQVHEQDSLLLLCTHCMPLTLLRSAFIIS
jgi:hypothetical protein